MQQRPGGAEVDNGTSLPISRLCARCGGDRGQAGCDLVRDLELLLVVGDGIG